MAKAAAGTTFEYVDDQGVTHSVDSIKKVPKKYIRTMLAVGADPVEETAQPPGPGFDLSGAPMPGGAQGPALIAALLLLVVILKSKSFILKVVAGVAVGAIAFYTLYGMAETSGFLKPAERKIRKIQAPAQEEDLQTLR